jgi:3-oxosteroid 1-dehydrogenase
VGTGHRDPRRCFVRPAARDPAHRERTLPRSILVNKLGRRFTDEAANYNALGGALHQLDATRFDYANLPCWLVFDAEYLARYGFRSVRPSDPAPEWMTQADSLDGLAAAIGVPADALTQTVTRWDSNVESGDDPDYHRGRSAYDRWSGDDAARGTVDSTLGPINKPPYAPTGMVYGGAGGTLGPIVTFAYRAGVAAARSGGSA